MNKFWNDYVGTYTYYHLNDIETTLDQPEWFHVYL